MSTFKDRVPNPSKVGWRELEIVDDGTAYYLSTGQTFKVKVDFADDPSEVGTPFAKSNIATPEEASEATDDSKIVTAYSLSGIKTNMNELAEIMSLGGLIYY
jgi:hypothetical protein